MCTCSRQGEKRWVRKKGYWRLEGGTIQTEGNRAEGGRDDASRTSLPTRRVFLVFDGRLRRVSYLTRVDSKRNRQREREREGKDDGREEKKKRGEKREKKEEKRKKYPRGATCATLSVEGCAEARYHEDPLSPLPPSDPFSALLPTSTFHPATPRCLRGDRANSTDHRAFLASLASTRCNPFSPPLLRNPVLEARSGRQPMRSVAGGERTVDFFPDIFFYTRGIDFASFFFLSPYLAKGKGILPIWYPYHARPFTTRTTSGTAPESRTPFN